jgi:hypothetical protein
LNLDWLLTNSINSKLFKNIASSLEFIFAISLYIFDLSCFYLGKQPCSVGSEGEELVKGHHPKPSQQIRRALELAASTNPSIDYHGWRKPPGLTGRATCALCGCGGWFTRTPCIIAMMIWPLPFVAVLFSAGSREMAFGCFSQ